MTAAYTLLLIVLVVIGFVAYPHCRDRWILRRSFPAHWRQSLERNLPFYRKLAPAEQQQLQRLIQLFIARKSFHGCGGLAITDEIRVTIAAQACLLLLNRNSGLYPKLQHILVYPAAFRAPQDHYSEDGITSHESVGLLGESWSNGKVILSWEDVASGLADFSDGHNVVLHEFSHQLDSESGSVNGAPLLGRNSYQSWAKVLSTEFQELQQALEHHHATVMDEYGATNPAEFFAVATETFFEKPVQMYERHPALFDELKTYYCVDPRGWV